MFLYFKLFALACRAGGSSFGDIIDIAGIEIRVFIDCPFISGISSGFPGSYQPYTVITSAAEIYMSDGFS